MGIDDESRHLELCSAVADGVTQNSVSLFREPDAVTPPVRFDEREQETESSQTGLRRVQRKPSPTATGRLKPLRLFSTLLIIDGRRDRRPEKGQGESVRDSRCVAIREALTSADLACVSSEMRCGHEGHAASFERLRSEANRRKSKFEC
jgi:hypothetical protein